MEVVERGWGDGIQWQAN